jgi:adenylylsulfate kinase-like enzyme
MTKQTELSSKVTVTVTGSQGSGKTRIAELLHDALLNAGALAVVNSKDPNRPQWAFNGMNVEIVEVQV